MSACLQMMAVNCPAGVGAGQQIQIRGPGGQMFNVAVPAWGGQMTYEPIACMVPLGRTVCFFLFLFVLFSQRVTSADVVRVISSP